MTDRELVERLWSRDQRVLREAQTLYGGYCQTLALRILGCGEDAEECVADVWLRLWNAVPPARPRSLRAYLAKITRNLAINRLESLRAERRGCGEATLVLEELAELLPGGESVEGGFDAKELSEAVNRFVRSLPRREGDIFIRRRCFFNESIVDIAARYDATPHSITAALSRTRQKLRKYLIKEGLLDE